MCIRDRSSDFHHFSGPSEYVHGLQRIETQASRMQNSPAIFAAAKCQISEIAGPNPTSHNTCTGCRESHQAALVHAPCALSRINRTHRRPSRDHERASDGVCSAANLDTYAGTHTDTGEMRMQIHAETSTGADTHRGTGADIDTDTETDTDTRYGILDTGCCAMIALCC